MECKDKYTLYITEIMALRALSRDRMMSQSKHKGKQFVVPI